MASASANSATRRTPPKKAPRVSEGTFQQFKCGDCRKRFIHNFGFEKQHATPEQITVAVDPVFSRLSARKTMKSIRMTCVKTSHVTVFNWTEVHFNLMDKFMYDITPQVDEGRRTDKLYFKIMGNRRYTAETKFVYENQAFA